MEENKNLLSEEVPENELMKEEQDLIAEEVSDVKCAEENVAETVAETEVTEDNATETEEEEDVHGENLSDRVRTLSPGRLVAKRFFRSKLSVIGLVTLVLLFLFSFVGPLMPGASTWVKDGEPVVDRNQANIKEIAHVTDIVYEVIVYEKVLDEDGNVVKDENGEDKVVPVKKTMVAQSCMTQKAPVNWYADMDSTHLLGTDKQGQDIFTNLMLGGRVSLTIGFIVIFLEAVIGVILGGIAGYFGGWVDNLIMRIVDILSCIPTIPIMLILSQMLAGWGIKDIRSLYFLMAMLTLLGWTGIARMVRGQILSLREQEFMLAAKCSGLSTPRKIFKHLLPNVMPQLIVQMTMGLGSIILTEATLGFLNIGVPMNTPTWGKMINSATQMNILLGYPNFWIPPGICITLAILAFNFVGDGLRDAFDPKMKR